MNSMGTRDGRWRIVVGGVSQAVVWYHLLGPGVDRWLPSTRALLEALTDAGVDLADLDETETSSAA